MKIKRGSIIQIGIMLVLGTFLLGTPALSFAQSAIDLTVTPVTQELALNPGETKTITVKFYNRTDTAVTGMFKKADFLVQDKDGTPTLLDSDASNNRFSAASWMTLSTTNVTIQPRTQAVLSVLITVPKDAYPCGRYTSVYFEPNPPTLGGKSLQLQTGSSVAYRLASMIFINVAGQCKENAFINNISVPSFLENGPIHLSFDILNRSDYHITPKALVTVTNMLNQEVDKQVMKEERIFPDALRTYQADLGSKWMIGKYNIQITGGYGSQGKTLSSYASVVVFPWRVVAVLILSLITIIILIKVALSKMSGRTATLETELKKERTEIEELKKQLKKRPD